MASSSSQPLVDTAAPDASGEQVGKPRTATDEVSTEASDTDAPSIKVCSDAAAAAKARQAELKKVYFHYLMTCCQTVMPFAQRQQVMLSLPQFAGDVGKVARFSALLSSTSGLTEFVLCPILGKLSDANGRKTFMKLGPLADIICYFLVWFKPSVRTLWIQALIGTPMNTFSGTTCAGASIMDIFREAPSELGNAFGGLLTPVGLGLISGPLLGQAMVKAGGGRPQAAFLGASICAFLQLLNVQSMKETLKVGNFKPMNFSLSDINPFTFLKLFTLKGPSSSALLKLTLIGGFLQKADEGKNLAGLHQAYALKDLNLSEGARSSFVSCVGLCVLISVRAAKLTMNKLGGHGHTTMSNLISVFALCFFATVPQRFKRQSWPMFLGLFISALGWNSDNYVKAQSSMHADACGIGNGEYSAMLANLRSVMSSLAPAIYANAYSWSTSGGRANPGFAYMVCASFKLVAELMYQTMSTDAIDKVL